ncbi:type I glutamate--ammonia ligase [Bifidobacterium bombi]|uniref:Glutamine synthetase n=1 Tax=Bifidobacterium bombi DSM 19703 TaxID=1341695 RepID=A0A080N2R4_9BIFI|nr:type I glutamate--ammonia ligase [Bifidobacterium bombi]KFF31297.1 glutamine synthase [Bifidobacterium bombi DSM 19703]
MAALETKEDFESFAKAEGAEYVSVRFTDLIGVQQHFTVPVDEYMDNAFTDGEPFDGSSIRGFQSIDDSDMKLVPDVSTAYVDPFRKHKTIVVAHSVVTPVTMEPYGRDPRQVAQKAEAYIRTTGVADTACFAPEPEFFLFDSVRYENSMSRSFYEVDSDEAPWNTGSETELDGSPNIGFKNSIKGGYFPPAPQDHNQDLRDDMVANLQKAGMTLERSHHEVGGAGQQEINYRFNTLLHAGDDLMKYKYIVHETAAHAGKAVTFMPKPIAGDNGTGMHCHQSLWKDGKPLFYDENGYGGLSDIARWYIGGLIHHASSVLAFTNPSLNSYKRLVPGYEAPTNLVYSARNRSAAIRIPFAGTSPAAKRIEFRVPDPSSNPYLAFSAQLMAGLDGVMNHTEPPEPVDKDIYELPPEELADMKHVPASLDEALDALEADNDFLTAGDVFTMDLIEDWIGLKREEIDQQRLAPTPLEYQLYFNI